ncbi:hypothetical protein D3C71_2179830 [compost metagenome]
MPCWWQKLHWEMKACLVDASGNGRVAACAEALRLLDSSSTEAILATRKSRSRRSAAASCSGCTTSLK